MTISEVDKILADKKLMAIATIQDEFCYSTNDMAREIYRLRQALEDRVVDNEIDRELEEQNNEVMFGDI